MSPPRAARFLPHPGIAAFLLLAVAPILLGVGYAAAYSLGLTGLVGEGFTLDAWAAVLSRRETWASVALSAGLAALVVGISASAALGLVLALGRRVAEGAIAPFVYLPLAFPATVVAFLVFQLFSGAGLVARVARGLGLVDDISGWPSLVHDPYGAGIVLAHVFLATPFLTLLLRRLWESERLDELARVAEGLGSPRGHTLRRVLVPALARRAWPTLALVYIFVLGSYEIPLLVGQQSPQMLSVVVMRKYARFDIWEKPEAFAVALVYTSLVALSVVALALGERRARVA